jgi:hypothetical protein
MIRKAVVSGQFYSRDTGALRRAIEALKPEQAPQMSAKGVILPHAGYMYSGKVAVATVNRVIAKKRIVLLGPNHTGLGSPFGLWPRGSWEIPFGRIAIDEELAESILNKGNRIEEDYEAHIQEHSLEVELPILYYFFGEFRFVPLVCTMGSLSVYREVADQIFQAIKHIKEEVLLVASTDLTHYEPDAAARAKDRAVTEAMVNLDEEDLVNKVRGMGVSMCGVAPVAICIACLKKMGAHKAQVALYQTSGDTSGDYSSVVGYVGIIVS